MIQSEEEWADTSDEKIIQNIYSRRKRKDNWKAVI